MSERETWDDWIADGRAIRHHSPNDFGWDGLDRRTFFRTQARGLDLIVRPSTGAPGTVSLFVGQNLIHLAAAARD